MTVFLSDLIQESLNKKKKVIIFKCRDGGYGIKINNKVVIRNEPWIDFDTEILEK